MHPDRLRLGCAGASSAPPALWPAPRSQDTGEGPCLRVHGVGADAHRHGRESCSRVPAGGDGEHGWPGGRGPGDAVLRAGAAVPPVAQDSSGEEESWAQGPCPAAQLQRGVPQRGRGAHRNTMKGLPLLPSAHCHDGRPVRHSCEQARHATGRRSELANPERGTSAHMSASAGSVSSRQRQRQPNTAGAPSGTRKSRQGACCRCAGAQGCRSCRDGWEGGEEGGLPFDAAGRHKDSAMPVHQHPFAPSGGQQLTGSASCPGGMAALVGAPQWAVGSAARWAAPLCCLQEVQEGPPRLMPPPLSRPHVRSPPSARTSAALVRFSQVMHTHMA